MKNLNYDTIGKRLYPILDSLRRASLFDEDLELSQQDKDFIESCYPQFTSYGDYTWQTSSIYEKAKSINCFLKIALEKQKEEEKVETYLNKFSENTIWMDKYCDIPNCITYSKDVYIKRLRYGNAIVCVMRDRNNNNLKVSENSKQYTGAFIGKRGSQIREIAAHFGMQYLNLI